nr:hypothetical protein [Tanacetum cinerariifolium]
VALFDGLPDLASADLFTAADGQGVRCVGGPVLGERERRFQPMTEAMNGVQLVLQRGAARGIDLMTGVAEERQGREFAGHLGGVGAHDARAVARQ